MVCILKIAFDVILICFLVYAVFQMHKANKDLEKWRREELDTWLAEMRKKYEELESNIDSNDLQS